MKNEWKIVVDNVSYHLKLKGTNIIINGEKEKLKKYSIKKGWLFNEYEIPVGAKKALLVAGTGSKMKLVVDGKDCATGEDYIPVVLPKWSYLFIVLHFFNILNGMIGWLLLVAGVSMTISISTNPKFHILVKLLLNIGVLVLSFLCILAIVLLI